MLRAPLPGVVDATLMNRPPPPPPPRVPELALALVLAAARTTGVLVLGPAMWWYLTGDWDVVVVRDVSIDGDEYDDDAATSDDREMGTMRGRLMTACWLLLLPPEAPLVTPEVALLARISSGLRMRI